MPKRIGLRKRFGIFLIKRAEILEAKEKERNENEISNQIKKALNFETMTELDDKTLKLLGGNRSFGLHYAVDIKSAGKKGKRKPILVKENKIKPVKMSQRNATTLVQIVKKHPEMAEKIIKEIRKLNKIEGNPDGQRIVVNNPMPSIIGKIIRPIYLPGEGFANMLSQLAYKQTEKKRLKQE